LSRKKETAGSKSAQFTERLQGEGVKSDLPGQELIRVGKIVRGREGLDCIFDSWSVSEHQREGKLAGLTGEGAVAATVQVSKRIRKAKYPNWGGKSSPHRGGGLKSHRGEALKEGMRFLYL